MAINQRKNLAAGQLGKGARWLRDHDDMSDVQLLLSDGKMSETADFEDLTDDDGDCIIVDVTEDSIPAEPAPKKVRFEQPELQRGDPVPPTAAPGRDAKRRRAAVARGQITDSQYAIQKTNKRYPCPLCQHSGTRMARILSHAVAKHNIQPGSRKAHDFKRQSTLMSRSGNRFVNRSKILALMGAKSMSKSHRVTVKRVLRGLCYTIGLPAMNQDDRRSSSFVVVPNAKPQSATAYGEKAGRSATSRRLKDADLVQRFEPDSLEPLAKAYLVEHPNGKTSFVYAKACKIDRYIKFGRSHGFSERQSLESVELARDFCGTLRQTLQPYSLRNHGDALVDLLQLTAALPSVKALFPPHRRKRVMAALEEWKTLRRRADKESRRQQLLKVKRLGFSAAPLYFICHYLADYKRDALENDFRTVEERIRTGSRFLLGDSKAYRSLVCYLSCVLALHGQRQVAAFSLTVADVKAATTYEGTNIVAIQRHKTDYLIGPAHVALKHHQFEALQRMARIRVALGGTDSSTVIAGVSGRQPAEPFKPLEESLKKLSKDQCKLTFNQIRRTAESNKGLADRTANLPTADRISSYLCHGQAAVNLHYAYKTPQQVVAEARALDVVHVQVLLQDMARQGQLPLPDSHPEAFPPANALAEDIQTIWPFPDVTFDGLSATTYGLLRQQWREVHRDQFIRDTANTVSQAINSGDLTPPRALIKAIVSASHEVWRSDPADLVGLTHALLMSPKNQ